jgi:hypothetical protein
MINSNGSFDYSDAIVSSHGSDKLTVLTDLTLEHAEYHVACVTRTVWLVNKYLISCQDSQYEIRRWGKRSERPRDQGFEGVHQHSLASWRLAV